MGVLPCRIESSSVEMREDWEVLGNDKSEELVEIDETGRIPNRS